MRYQKKLAPSMLRNWKAMLMQTPISESVTISRPLVPFFVMVFLAKGFVAATPLIVRGISGNLMVAAAPAVVAGSSGIMRGLFNTAGVKGRSRIGALTTGEGIGRGVAQGPAVVRAAATTASAHLVRMSERAKRLSQ
jgi:type IV secretion system protein VirB6